MKIVALAQRDAEFIYSPRTAHKVNPRKADAIRDALNAACYKTDAGHVWHVYDIGYYDRAFDYAEIQEFTCGKTGIRRRSAYSFGLL